MNTPITLADIKDFYEAKKITAGCPACGKSDWIFAEPDVKGDLWALGSIQASGNMTLPFPTIPLAVLACKNCHHLRIHAAIPILEWLRQKEPKNGGNHPDK